MYSYEDRIRAVELYIKLGKRVRPTIGQLGYPTKNALKGWYREYEQRFDLPVGYAGREPKYSQAQKEAAVEHYLTHDRCIAATMRALGYPGRETLSSSVRLVSLMAMAVTVTASPTAIDTVPSCLKQKSQGCPPSRGIRSYSTKTAMDKVGADKQCRANVPVHRLSSSSG